MQRDRRFTMLVLTAFGFAIAVLLIVAQMASWVPARRASRVDPILALRAD